MLLVVLAAVGACGRGDDRTPQEIVFASAAATEEAKSSKILMTVDVPKSDVTPATTITAEGAFDYETRSGRMVMQLPIPGGGEIEMVTRDDVVYMRMPPQMSAGFGGKPWVSIDLADAAAASGGDLSAFGPVNGIDPTQALAQLRGVTDDVRAVGEETVRGTKTTKYRLTIDLARVVEQAPEAQREMVRNAVEKLGSGAVPAEAWIDAEGRLRKFTQRTTIDGIGETVVTMELFDFGTDVVVEAPPADQVADLGPMLRQGAGATPQN